jgi:hypothetical protein
MLPEYYDRFLEEYLSSVGEFAAEFDRLMQDGPEAETIASFQQNVIDLCTGFEEEWLTSRNEITVLFEDICEALYQLMNGDAGAADRIRKLFAGAPELFGKCYDRAERKLAIALIEKNEARYLKEWMEYHRMQGAEYFYLYDHGSTDGSVEALRPYVEAGIAELECVEGEHHPTQMAVYNDAVKKSRYFTKYLAFIDADEFLVPMAHERAIDAIESIFQAYESNPFKIAGSGKAGGIGVNWRVFGTSGHEHPVDGLVTEEYTRRGPDNLGINCHIKTICDPRTVSQIVNPHFAIYKPGYWCISEHGSLIPTAFFYDSMGDILRVNHYYTKSEEEYRTRRMNYVRAAAGPQRLRTEEEILRTNEVEDHTMARFLPELKRRM